MVTVEGLLRTNHPRRLRVAGAALAVLSLVSASLLATPAAAGPGEITTVAGGPGEGPATSLSQSPVSVAVNGGTIYVADGIYHVVRAVDMASGNETVVAGNGGTASTVTGARPPLPPSTARAPWPWIAPATST